MNNEANKLTRSRFEIEEHGEVAYLEFETDSQGWMTIWLPKFHPLFESTVSLLNSRRRHSSMRSKTIFVWMSSVRLPQAF